MNHKLKVGILGCADIATRILIPEFHKHFQFELHTIASRDLDKARAIAQTYQCSHSSYDDLINNQNIDVIYIPLPTGLHKEWVIKALNANKHVLCEKSLGVNFDEVAEMVALARVRKLALVENFQFRFHSQQIFIKNIINQGELGDIRVFKSSFGFPPFSVGNIRYSVPLGGGALLDAGAYTLKASQFFLNDKFTVRAADLFYVNEDVDIYGSAYLQGEQFISQVAFGFDNFYQCNIEIWGSKGKLVANRVFTAHANFQPEVIIESNNKKCSCLLPSDNHFANMLQHFATIVMSKEFESEYSQNLEQALLIQQVKNKVNG